MLRELREEPADSADSFYAAAAKCAAAAGEGALTAFALAAPGARPVCCCCCSKRGQYGSLGLFFNLFLSFVCMILLAKEYAGRLGTQSVKIKATTHRGVVAGHENTCEGAANPTLRKPMRRPDFHKKKKTNKNKTPT